MGQDLFDHRRIFDARSHLERTTTVRAGQDVYLEHPLQPLRLRLIETWRAGAGIAPVSHASLYSEYARVFYLQVEAEPIIVAAALPLLREKLGEPGEEEAAFARICIDIIASKKKMVRTGKEPLTVGSFNGIFVVIHYD